MGFYDPFTQGLLSSVLMWVFRKLKPNKIAKLEYTITNEWIPLPIGVVESDVFFLSNVEVKDIYLSKITMYNTIGRDLTNFCIKVRDYNFNASTDTRFASINVLLIERGGATFFPGYSSDYLNRLNNSKILSTLEREYYIPVFNRDCTIEFTCVIVNTPRGVAPNIRLICLHEGLEIANKPIETFTIYRIPIGVYRIFGWVGILLSFPVIHFVPRFFDIFMPWYLSIGLIVCAVVVQIIALLTCKFLAEKFK